LRKNHRNTIRVFPLLLSACALSACSVFDDYMTPREAEVAAAEPVAARGPVEPISRNYFTLESADQTVIGEPQIMHARSSDTFSDIAREYGLGFDELVAANPHIDPWLPGEDTPVLLPTQYVLPNVPHRGITLNIASKRLFYFPSAGEGEKQVVMTFPIGIGRVGWETPLGGATVISKARDPSWWVPASVRKEHAEAGNPLPSVVPPGPENPLGRFVLKLDMPGYLIHGTNQPYGVGMRVSHGCVRLYPENIELLYSLVETGEAVQIINKPYLAGRKDGQLYLEAHTALEDDLVSPEDHLQLIFESARSESGAFSDEEEQMLARVVTTDARGVPVRVLLDDADEIFERARLVRNTVERDPNAPTLAEVRAILDAPPEADESVVPDELDGGTVAND
jgi:L,D-transpeptidase ErfK/SrfK